MKYIQKRVFVVKRQQLKRYKHLWCICSDVVSHLTTQSLTQTAQLSTVIAVVEINNSVLRACHASIYTTELHAGLLV